MVALRGIEKRSLPPEGKGYSMAYRHKMKAILAQYEKWTIEVLLLRRHFLLVVKLWQKKLKKKGQSLGPPLLKTNKMPAKN
jgi:hypothetical protein